MAYFCYLRIVEFCLVCNVVGNVAWEVLGKQQLYNPSAKRFYLCLNKIAGIAIYKERNMLNHRLETINKCQHQYKLALALYDSKK